MHPLDEMSQLIAMAKQERNMMAATTIILLKKLGGDAIVTKGEIEEAMSGKLEVRQEEETELGFKLAVHEIQGH